VVTLSSTPLRKIRAGDPANASVDALRLVAPSANSGSRRDLTPGGFTPNSPTSSEYPITPEPGVLDTLAKHSEQPL